MHAASVEARMARTALAWLRRDLRLQDSEALAEAARSAEAVAVLFVFDRNILDPLEDRDDRRVTFIHHSLQEVDARLRECGSRLIVRHGDPVVEVQAVAEALGAEVVVTARDREPYALERDATVSDRLKRIGISFVTVKDQVIFEAGEVRSQSGDPLRVYSPYRRAWLARFQPGVDDAPADSQPSSWVSADRLGALVHPWEMSDLGFREAELWLPAGESGAIARLREFERRIENYREERDIPSGDRTSGLSVHLRFGTLSVRECFRTAARIGGPGAEKWRDELIWREFYQDILGNFPHVVASTFQPAYRDLVYPGSDAHFQAWRDGQTGYPLVDAAMRCLNATGWMHNRLRMVAASFLTKDLLVDYRRGEAYFARKLLDFDLASNNGGWQWAASVGADPQPYFRIFNPVLQSRKFDPEGAFIRQWVPELGGLSDADLHMPSAAEPFDLLAANVTLGRDYPSPIVDHHVQKELAVRLLGDASAAARGTS